MITEFYENPNKPKNPYQGRVAHYTFGTPKEPDMANGHGQKFNEHWAKKLNLSLDEYVRRDVMIQNAAKGVYYSKNAVVYPKKIEDYQRLGKCRVLDVIRSIKEWPEDLQWSDEHIYIVEAYSEENKFTVFRATGGYFGAMPPISLVAPTEPEINK